MARTDSLLIFFFGFVLFIEMSLELRKAYLSVIRAVQRKFDSEAQLQVMGAIKHSIYDMHRNFPEDVIVAELFNTCAMLNENIAQVAYSDKSDSYTVRLTEDHLKGGELNIQSPQELQEDSSVDVLGERFSKK